MSKKEKIDAITRLIETGRIADRIINTCAQAIGQILDDEEAGELSKDFIFFLKSDPSPKECAQILLKEAEK